MNDTDNLTVPSGDLQRKTREVLNAVVAGRHVHITRYGAREAVVVSADWYDQHAEDMPPSSRTAD